METISQYNNCTINNLIKIEREHFYSIMQNETYISKCGDEVIETYEIGNFNDNAIIVLVIGFSILGIYITSFLFELIKNKNKKI